MITLLARLFIRDRDKVADAGVRRAYGMLCSLTGIGLNVLLFLGKYLAGRLSGSIAMTADAFNNLSDAGSSVITLLGFRMAAKKPDPGHPFGHGRIEYLSGVAVSLIIIVVGVQLGLESIDKIISPEPVDAGLVPMLVLVASICVKGYMFAYNRGIGRKINSPGMSATAMDSLSDSIATSVVLISMLLARFADVNVDGWGGAAVAVFIIFSGFKAAKETLSPLLGNPPDPQLVRDITDIVMSHPEVLNVHDLIVHDYGPGRLMISLHAEVPGDGDIYALHDAIDTAEYELQQKLGCSAVIHMDPVSPDGTKTAHMREELAEAAKAIDPRLTIHDFRIVDGPTHTNVIFDAVLPNDSSVTEDDAKAQLETIVHSLWQNSHPKVHIDRPFV
ncbi:MAG: cation diffusion facilitator family transporter [Oscillospiraceae bacterium]|nr:cation diffusion facilitator family transporter [Oscillospiraceae bacterium]